ncbi:MAG: A/G-specific adenine glycosylase [Saprospiraceae bacterium]|nr:A/G-specific adenine glycosylase [Saprospiraceae bacterium]
MLNTIAPPDDRLVAFFRKNLLDWSLENPRPMPWKGETDPYKIWLSEIILQQTRVEQGLPYYQKFVAKYPRVQQLADAPEDEVMKLWEGLGYYTRARNLHAAAKFIADELGGIFPNTYEGIRRLKGVGAYTASAIASFAYGLPHAVLDGNVYRVLARFFGIETSTDTPAAQKLFAALAQNLLNPDFPAAHNQAMMDFGATCCTPKQARCPDCPLWSECQAYRMDKVSELPLKSKGLVKKNRLFHYLVFNHQGHVYVRKRSGKDIWRGLWEFPQTDGPVQGADFGASVVRESIPFRQLLTHQAVTAVFFEIDLPDDIPDEIFQNPLFEGCERISRKELKKNIAFPRVIDCYLQNIVLTLN